MINQHYMAPKQQYQNVLSNTIFIIWQAKRCVLVYQNFCLIISGCVIFLWCRNWIYLTAFALCHTFIVTNQFVTLHEKMLKWTYWINAKCLGYKYIFCKRLQHFHQILSKNIYDKHYGINHLFGMKPMVILSLHRVYSIFFGNIKIWNQKFHPSQQSLKKISVKALK